jgi:hypothetical protein
LVGTVSGTVYYSDTNLPARAAQVSIDSYSTDAAGRQVHFAAESRTDLDGRFAIANVPEGNFILRAAAFSAPLEEMKYKPDPNVYVPPGMRLTMIPAQAAGAFAEIPLILASDVSDVSITVADPPGNQEGTAFEPVGSGSPPDTRTPQ